MGIILSDYVKNVDEILTLEDAERLFIVAGYVKVDTEIEADRLSTEYRDCNGELLTQGTTFVYQFGRPSEINGEIKVISGSYYIQWSDSKELELLKDFWYAPVDEPVTKIINKL